MLKSEASSSTQGICFRSHNPDENDVKQANRFFDTKCCKHAVCLFCMCRRTIKMYGQEPI